MPKFIHIAEIKVRMLFASMRKFTGAAGGTLSSGLQASSGSIVWSNVDFAFHFRNVTAGDKFSRYPLFAKIRRNKRYGTQFRNVEDLFVNTLFKR